MTIGTGSFVGAVTASGMLRADHYLSSTDLTAPAGEPQAFAAWEENVMTASGQTSPKMHGAQTFYPGLTNDAPYPHERMNDGELSGPNRLY